MWPEIKKLLIQGLELGFLYKKTRVDVPDESFNEKYATLWVCKSFLYILYLIK